MKNGFSLDDRCSCIIEYLAHDISLWLHSSFLPMVTGPFWRGARISSIRSRRHVTVSILAWPASSGAAVFAASCLSELPVPLAVGTTTGSVQKRENWIKFLNNKTEMCQICLINGYYLQPVDMGSCNVDLWIKKDCVSHSSSARKLSILILLKG